MMSEKRADVWIDRRHRWWGRGAVLLGAAGLAALALSGSGFRLEWPAHREHPIARPAVPRSSGPMPGNPAKRFDPVGAFAGVKSSISQTPQRLILTGTLVGRNAHEGRAFIGVDAHDPQTYIVGALLANGVRLAEIYEDHVVLAKSGRAVALYLQQAKGSAGARNTDLLMVGGRTAVTPSVATSSEPFTDYIRPSPVYDGPTLRGFEVYPGKEARVFTQLGLQGGDVITALEGQPFSDPAQAVDLFRQLADGVAMTATVIRKGRAQGIPLDGSLIAAARASVHETLSPAGGKRSPPPG